MSTFGGGYKVDSKLNFTGGFISYTVPANKFAIFSMASFPASSAPVLTIDSASMSITPGSSLTLGTSSGIIFPGGIFAGPGAVVSMNLSSGVGSLVGVLYTN